MQPIFSWPHLEVKHQVQGTGWDSLGGSRVPPWVPTQGAVPQAWWTVRHNTRSHVHDNERIFMSLFCRLSYIVYILEQLLKTSHHQKKVFILYDVACLLQKHFQASIIVLLKQCWPLCQLFGCMYYIVIVPRQDRLAQFLRVCHSGILYLRTQSRVPGMLSTLMLCMTIIKSTLCLLCNYWSWSTVQGTGEGLV